MGCLHAGVLMHSLMAGCKLGPVWLATPASMLVSFPRHDGFHLAPHSWSSGKSVFASYQSSALPCPPFTQPESFCLPLARERMKFSDGEG